MRRVMLRYADVKIYEDECKDMATMSKAGLQHSSMLLESLCPREGKS